MPKGTIKTQTDTRDNKSRPVAPTQGKSSPNKTDNKKQSTLGTWLNIKEPLNFNTNSTKLTFDPNRATPPEVQEINTNNQMVTQLLKRALSNAFRHGLNLRAGKLNAANGNCLWDSIINNILGRICYKKKLGET